ncbi:transposase (IS4 family protein), partial [mine drainage metagenome]
DHFIERIGVDQLLEVFVPHNDFRIKLAPAKALGVVVRNLVLHREPIYSLNEWAKPFDAKLLGIDAGDVDLLNDDRVGRSLARLFDSDRASLLNRLVLDVVDRFSIDTNQLHNDSTSVRFAGSYRNANGSIRAGKTTPAILHGHSKDHRPDLKQLVWILTISSDGAVPIACRVANGNVTDDTTHIATWDSLVSLLGRSDFLYVADSKLATKTNMDHIVKGNGRFISVLPATRKEDSALRRYVVDHELTWVEAIRHTARRKDQPEDLWWTTEAPWPSAEGYRIIWVK